ERYRWWVRAESSNGTLGSWSSPMHFAITALGTPIPAGPSGTLTTDQPTFSWSPVSLAVRYDVWVTDMSDGTLNGVIGSSTSTSLAAPSPLTPSHSYRWWVRAVSSNGTTGPWSASTDFFTR